MELEVGSGLSAVSLSVRHPATEVSPVMGTAARNVLRFIHCYSHPLVNSFCPFEEVNYLACCAWLELISSEQH
ncbi:uncharacterized protein OE_5294R (plasmid) [Halobacterium salinarum R1]|uniref:Uncharacterized protein n=1 Tax=Halobacterium salinarum (strain ATCC 29341 / DSM 671 / R1) TaxID=478009 RepID=B0RA18_HALS3|nr:uncharacterized protein OE_5294R [Halobacterium salinarum R1]